MISRFLIFTILCGLVFSCSEEQNLPEDQLTEDAFFDDDKEQDGSDSDNDEGQESDSGNEEGSNEEESDETQNTESEEESDTTVNDCPNNVGFFFEEFEGVVSIEFEDNDFPDGWSLKKEADNFSGEGYMQWEGNQSLGNPGKGLVTFPILISTPGTYRFIWKSSYRKGNNGTEHNDSWLRFPDANDFFGMKRNGSSVVYPKGSGKEPNPNGSSKDGWFKVYRSGDDNSFKWQAKTSDNDAHDIYVTFEAEGFYIMEVSGRSDFHAIDRILLFKNTISQNEAIGMADNYSTKTVCN